MDIDLEKMAHDACGHGFLPGPSQQEAEEADRLKQFREVVSKVLDESIKISEDWMVGNISDKRDTSDYLRDLKRELCG
jgi:hypothetical protein